MRTAWNDGYDSGMDGQLMYWLQSSQNPDEIANKVKGAILAASSIIILVAMNIFHISLNASDVATLSAEVGTMAGAIWAIYGCVLNLVTWLGTKKQ